MTGFIWFLVGVGTGYALSLVLDSVKKQKRRIQDARL